MAASLERGSEHPLAAAIVGGAQERGLSLANVGDFQSATGRGITGTIAGRKVALGQSPVDGRSQDRRRRRLPTKPSDCAATGRPSCSWLIDGKPAGLMGVADPIKSNTAEAIRIVARMRRSDRDANRR